MPARFVYFSGALSSSEDALQVKAQVSALSRITLPKLKQEVENMRPLFVARRKVSNNSVRESEDFIMAVNVASGCCLRRQRRKLFLLI